MKEALSVLRGALYKHRWLSALLCNLLQVMLRRQAYGSQSETDREGKLKEGEQDRSEHCCVSIH